MFLPIKGGTKEIISNNDGFDFVCWVPPLGYGINAETGELQQTDILKRSNTKSQQYWDRTPLPMDTREWNHRREAEREQQEDDPNCFDPVLKKFEEQEWKRRLCGVWFYNNGIPTYITGTHYLFLNWWIFKGKRMEYRRPNRDFFYVWDYCVEDSDALGLIEFSKRKIGKTARAGVVLYEYISRVANKHGGIQSKTDDDAEEVFQLAVVAPWRKLPDFFRPTYDVSLGTNPKSELRFFEQSRRGKRALEEMEESNELESWIDYKSRAIDAYDGPEVHRYVSDEAGKLKDVSIVKRHERVMFSSEVDGKYVGKHFYTTTVEEMDSGGGEFQKLVKESNPLDKAKNKSGRTNTGLYYIFWPAYETMDFDLYGEPPIEKNKKFFLDKRADLAENSSGLSSFIRKNPFTVAEAFRIDDDKGLYNADKLNKRLEYLMWNEVTERGNFMWEGGIPDTKVVWAKNKNGRWEMPRGFHFATEEETNNVIKRGNVFLPGNKLRFSSGVDPYDHNKSQTQDGRASKLAVTTKKKHDPLAAADDPFDNAFVCKYLFRPAMASMAHEDALMQCVYFGSPILVENNKPGIIGHFQRRGYGDFLIHLPGYLEPGIPSTADNKASLAEVTEEYIEQNIDKVYFKDLIEQWLKFDLANTLRHDLAMAAGWNLIADDRFKARQEATPQRDVEEYFRMYKAS